MATCNFSLLCWNINKKSKDCKEYILKSKADICFLQEGKVTVDEQQSATQYKTLYLKESNSSYVYNSILYNSNKFEVYKVRDGSREVQCAIDEEICKPGSSWHQDWPNKEKEINLLKKFAENTDKTVCVAILQCMSSVIQSQPKIIVVSCHVPAKDGGNRVDYTTKILEQLKMLSEETGYSLILGGDFNCDLFKENNDNEEISQLGYVVPKYDPTIRRVVCSGGSPNKCIDYFAYYNCSGHVITKVSYVSADIVWPFDDPDFLDWDKCSLPQYQEHLTKNSTLDKIKKAFSDHDPLKATLCITDLSSAFPIAYCDLEKLDKMDMVAKHFMGLNPRPELCIFQNVVSPGRILTDLELTVAKCTESCFVAYNRDTMNISSFITKDDLRICTIQWLGESISFKLAILYDESKKEETIEKKFETLSEEVTPTCPILLVGGFYVDLFRVALYKKENITHGFEVPEYSPTMHRVTHKYGRSNLHLCRDFFTFRNSTDVGSSRLTVDNVQAEMINPPSDLIRGSYNVNYDLIWDKSTVLEILTAIISITPPRIPSTPTSVPHSASSELTPQKSQDKGKTTQARRKLHVDVESK